MLSQRLDQDIPRQIVHNNFHGILTSRCDGQRDDAVSRIHGRHHRQALICLENESNHADLAPVNPVQLLCRPHGSPFDHCRLEVVEGMNSTTLTCRAARF